MFKALRSGGAARLRAALYGSLLFAAAAATAAEPAVVGKGAVTEADLADWQAAQACYGPDALTSRRAAFMRLFEASLLEETLAGAGRPVTKEEYSAEAARIGAETRAPEILACIKKYFAEKPGRYERVFLRPILAQRFIREFVKSDARVQARAFSQRDKVAAQVLLDPAPEGGVRPFAEIGAELGVAYASATYALEPDAEEQAAGRSRWSPFEPAFIEQQLQGLKPGEVNFSPAEDELSTRFVRFLGVEGKKYRFETLTVYKISTEAYLKSVPKVGCWIEDAELRVWVSGIKGNPLLAPAKMLTEAPAKPEPARAASKAAPKTPAVKK